MSDRPRRDPLPEGEGRREKTFREIGKRRPLVDARGKVTGEAVYTDDLKLPGMLVGKVLRSPVAHARIVRLDTSRAEAIPGVRAVATARDSAVSFGVLPLSHDETAFAVDKVRFVGDQVAAVAADDEEIALEALAAIDVGYEELRPFLEPEDSLAEVPPELKIWPKTRYASNLFKAVDQSFGDVDAAIAGAKVSIRRQFEFIGVTHAFTEPHCVIAHQDTEERLTVWSATQVPHYLHRALAEVMQMPMHRIRVVRPAVGGAFGGKSDPFPHEMAAALLSRKCRRPVKILFDREEVFYSNHGRHPTKQDVTIAVGNDHAIAAYDIKALIDGGAWGSFGIITTYYNGVLSVGPYRVPNFRYGGKRVYTNKTPCGAMRGHGAVNTRFAVECVLDEVCEGLGEDPIEFRIRNALPPFCTTVNGFRITSNGIVQCLERARERSGWRDKFQKLPYGRGIGVGCGFYISGSALPIHWEKMPQSTVHLKVDFDGGVTVHSLAAEIGQGSDTVLAQCVCEVLGLPLARVRVRSQDSDTAPVDLGSYSSRVTFMAGNAARRAAEQLRDQVVRAAARLTGYPWEGFVLEDERAIFAPNPRVTVTWDDAVKEALHESGALIAKGHYQGPPKMGGTHKGAAAGLAPSYSFSAFVAEVEVDKETGAVRCTHVWAAHDCGRALNPVAVEGQIEGCVHMGLGQALMEEFPYNRGAVLNPNLLDYRTVPPRQVPKVEVLIVETDDPEGPFGAKEAGEGPILPIAPAVANAVYDAVGVRMRRLPMTPDRVYEAMLARARAGARGRARAT